MLEWISVEDGLPEDYESVLVFGENGRGEVEYGFFTKGGGWLIYDPSAEFGLDYEEVSHWMPRPERPDGNDTKEM